MNRLRTWLAGLVLLCCATVTADGSRPIRASFDTKPWTLQFAIWERPGSVAAPWEFDTVRYDPTADTKMNTGTQSEPGAPFRAPGLRLLDRQPAPPVVVWPWALAVVIGAGLYFLTMWRRTHGRIVAVRAVRVARPGSTPTGRNRRRL